MAGFQVVAEAKSAGGSASSEILVILYLLSAGREGVFVAYELPDRSCCGTAAEALESDLLLWTLALYFSSEILLAAGAT